MDTTIAQRRLEPYFAQIQVSTYQPSNTVFRLCLHLYMNDVRRPSCTLRNETTGAVRGAQGAGRQRGVGDLEYRTAK